MNKQPRTDHLKPGPGRPRGSKNKQGVRFEELCAKYGYSPGEVSILAAMNRLPCGKCDGTGKTKFQPANGQEPGVRTCQSCWGSGFEHMSPKDRCFADIANAGRIYPQLKAVEHSGEINTGVAELILEARKKRLG